jgi:hypothetical protein
MSEVIRSAVDCGGKTIGGDATATLSALGDLQESHLRYVRSLKRAEQLIGALLAPCIRAAMQEDYTPPDSPPTPDWRACIVPEPTDNVLVGDEVERAIADLEWHYIEALDKEYRAEKRSKRRPPCNEIPTDWTQDALTFERLDFVLTYPKRLAQANRGYSGTLAQWERYAARNHLDDSTYDIEPRSDGAQDMLADLWRMQCEYNSPTWTLRMHRIGRSQLEAWTQEPEAIPNDLTELLTPVENRVLALILADASERDIERQVGCYRENIPRIVETIRAKTLPWALSIVIE